MKTLFFRGNTKSFLQTAHGLKAVRNIYKMNYSSWKVTQNKKFWSPHLKLGFEVNSLFLLQHRRSYSTVDFSSPAYKIEQLTSKGADFVSNEMYKEALPVLEGALDLVNVHKVTHVSLITQLYVNLAYVYQHLQQLSSAEEMYSKALVLIFPSSGAKSPLRLSDQAAVLTNYAEFLVSMKKIEEGVEQVQKAVQILRGINRPDCFLAAALSNLAGYLSVLERHEEAKEPASEALKIFTKELGRQNDYTRNAFSHMYQILTKLGLEEAVADLESDWNAVDKQEVRGLSNQELANMAEHFMHSVQYAESKSNPPGPTKGPKLYKKELNEFFGSWKDKDPAFSPVLKQEFTALEAGIKTRKKLEEDLKLKRHKIIQERTENVEKETAYLHRKDKEERTRREWKVFTDGDAANQEVVGLEQYLDRETLFGENPKTLAEIEALDKRNNKKTKRDDDEETEIETEEIQQHK
eukprot:TRINITY_DN3072_c0_g1_i1.p1 TRINITY_DN3072_c0_g1~~TRINITY_DN3072_c0_g1_i1.p1  ORF type:complete len:465 (-),score=113.49 TRINITY_DN3072_c0_g1_i1:18-1412(-)